MGHVLVERLSVEQALVSSDARDRWPFTVPCIAALAREGLELTRPVTFLVGENGSGKSTVVEAVAEAFGLDARGGRAGRKYGNAREKTPLGEVMRLGLTREGARMRGGPRSRRRGYFLRAETTFGFAEAVSGRYGYWQEDLSQRSHGEGFLMIFESMFREPGLYSGGRHRRGRRPWLPACQVGSTRPGRPLAPLPEQSGRLSAPPDRTG